MTARPRSPGGREARRDPVPRQYISVCGFSSVGKKTLIRKLLAGEHRERFGLTGSVEAYGWAFEPLDQMFGSRSDNVLYQWQIKTDSLIDDLLERFPDARHRVIVLWRPWREHLRDWIADYGDEMTGEPSVANIIDWWNEVITPRFKHELPAKGIAVEVVDGSTPDYRRVDWTTVERLAVEYAHRSGS